MIAATPASLQPAIDGSVNHRQAGCACNSSTSGGTRCNRAGTSSPRLVGPACRVHRHEDGDLGGVINEY